MGDETKDWYIVLLSSGEVYKAKLSHWFEDATMETIKGHCKTNLDDYEMIVRKFYRVPNIGERVAVLHKGNRSSLKVCQITHEIKVNEPYIIVELHN